MQLPECLLIDEFKGTSDCNGKMCFILSDGQSGKIIDILDDRAFACARALQVTDLRLSHPCTLSSLFEKKRRLKKNKNRRESHRKNNFLSHRLNCQQH